MGSFHICVQIRAEEYSGRFTVQLSTSLQIFIDKIIIRLEELDETSFGRQINSHKYSYIWDSYCIKIDWFIVHTAVVVGRWEFKQETISKEVQLIKHKPAAKSLLRSTNALECGWCSLPHKLLLMNWEVKFLELSNKRKADYIHQLYAVSRLISLLTFWTQIYTYTLVSEQKVKLSQLPKVVTNLQREVTQHLKLQSMIVKSSHQWIQVKFHIIKTISSRYKYLADVYCWDAKLRGGKVKETSRHIPALR